MSARVVPTGPDQRATPPWRGIPAPLRARRYHDLHVRFETIDRRAGTTISVDNPEAGALTRRFAELAGVGITEAIVIAMTEAFERRRTETPRETAARPRAKRGVVLSQAARAPLPREAYDAMWAER
ncbi:type II toxin-antitoxin system VapB family antitoxin [Methylobacterium sp. 17Sr1-1]|uniref:type II toxin-antitoxin system VapB family antitoxin n=1 Tax=Methylobacterium sp. 17Sr1-1 TaxID=2202826 RepID=UPI000D6ECF8F|nr:type II toxin-antitoxin system VapB family antitoxin [Methylobacterium sp. 17Sr1-1]AWN53861.1 hypothetical protein DK412_21475 [Methylobacterium sp. 17Sr1-1]